MKSAVLIVSSGRPEILRETVQDVLSQSHPPVQIVLSTIKSDDWVKQPNDDPRIEHIHGLRGIPRQLNAAIDRLKPDVEAVFIFDDDVALAPDYCERAIVWLREEPDLCAFDGIHLRDGNITREEADRIIFEDQANRQHTRIERNKLYGCNMVTRKRVLDAVRFDENLEGYAWLFEVDWARRVQALGKTGRVRDCRFVHLMATTGRGPGYNMGYMQVMHPHYLFKKGLIPTNEFLKNFIWRHLLINAAKSVIGDCLVDRPGRLKGNLRALLDIIIGKSLISKNTKKTY